MTRKKTQRKKDHTAVGMIAASLMVAVTVFFGWRAVNIINPPIGEKAAKTDGSDGVRAFIVYRSYKVADRGATSRSDDDVVTYEFFRYPLEGSAAVGESIAKETRGGSAPDAGAPWMSKVSDTILLFARRSSGPDDALWVDVSGNGAGKTDAADIVWSGLPSPDGSRIAFRDSASGKIMVVDRAGNRSEYPIPAAEGAKLTPSVWDASGDTLFVGVGPGIENGDSGVAGGLWRLHIPSRSAAEIETVRGLGLRQLDIDPSSGRIAGVTYACESLETCGRPPSSLYLADALSGVSAEALSSESSVFGRPMFSPDGTRIAYTVTDGSPDVWVADAAVSGHERRVVSGHLLDWTPDGAFLVVDRDNELQLVSVSDGASRTVVRRSGEYQDQDFHGVDYVGIIVKR